MDNTVFIKALAERIAAGSMDIEIVPDFLQEGVQSALQIITERSEPE